MSEISKAERQVYILSLLSEHENGMTAADIQLHLENMELRVSKKTLERDIDDLSRMNFQITEEKRCNKLYYMAKKFNLSNIAFTLSELLSLYFIREMVSHYTGLAIGKEAAGLLDKIIGQAPAINQEYLNSIKKIVKVYPANVIEDNVDNQILESVERAARMDKRIKISYEPFSGEKTENRTLDPYNIELHDGCYHLIAYCHLRGCMREFRISRITKVIVLEECFKRKPRLYDEFIARSFGNLTGDKDIQLKVRFTGNAARYTA